MVHLHGLPLSITSDRDEWFVSAFWKTIWKRVGTKLNFNTSFHPQIDRKMEVVNKKVGNRLRCLVGENIRSWDLLSSQVEFAYNNSTKWMIGLSPFQIVYGQMPLFPVDISFHAIERESKVANAFMREGVDFLKEV